VTPKANSRSPERASLSTTNESVANLGSLIEATQATETSPLASDLVKGTLFVSCLEKKMPSLTSRWSSTLESKISYPSAEF